MPCLIVWNVFSFLGQSRASVATRKLLEALRYLHKKGIVHRDIKPENLLLTNAESGGVSGGGDEGGGGVEIKLADFGLSRLRVGREAMRTVCGTWAYSAPEVRIFRRPYSHKVDLWSLGVITFVLLSGYHPFDPDGDVAEEQLQYNIRYAVYDFEDPVRATNVRCFFSVPSLGLTNVPFIGSLCELLIRFGTTFPRRPRTLWLACLWWIPLVVWTAALPWRTLGFDDTIPGSPPSILQRCLPRRARPPRQCPPPPGKCRRHPCTFPSTHLPIRPPPRGERILVGRRPAEPTRPLRAP